MRIKVMAVFLLLSLALSGCGGGGGSDTPATTTTTTSTTGTISGTVSLPANTNAKLFDVKLPLYARLFATPAHAAAVTDLTTLTVKVGSVTTNPNASGAYTLTVDAGTNLDLTVRTPSGNVVLEAIIPSVTAGSSASQDVNTTTTAIALIYKQNTSLSISQISSSSAVTNVKTAIETALTDSTVDSVVSNSTVTSAAATAATTIASGTTVPSAPTLTSLSVSCAPNSIKTGQTAQCTATGTYSDNSTKDISSSVTWTSSNTSVGSISSAGLFTASASGTANISATKDGISSNAVSISVSSGEGTIHVGWRKAK